MVETNSYVGEYWIAGWSTPANDILLRILVPALVLTAIVRLIFYVWRARGDSHLRSVPSTPISLMIGILLSQLQWYIVIMTAGDVYTAMGMIASMALASFVAAPTLLILGTTLTAYVALRRRGQSLMPAWVLYLVSIASIIIDFIWISDVTSR
jgi:hypothetical protein